MVDFQSRDTRRDLADEEEADEKEESEEEAAEDELADSEEEQEPASESVEYDPATEGVTYAVVTVANDQTLDSDPAGDTVVTAIEEAGDGVVTRELISPSYDGVQQSLNALVNRKDVDCVVTVGGTSIEPDDLTVDAALATFDRHLPGFGELFRILSHEHDGSAVVRTRATAGVIRDVPVFCLPGEESAARRGTERIIVDEAPELVDLATEGDSPPTNSIL